MTDHAPLVAAYLAERPADNAEPDVIWAEMRRRWFSLTREEGARGAQITAEILAGTIAEKVVTLVATEASFALNDEPQPPVADEPRGDDDAERDR